MRNIISRIAVPASVLAATLLAGCGQAPTEPSPPQATAAEPVVSEHPDRVLVAVLGDSLAAGYGLPASEAFPAVTGELLRERGHELEVINAGVSGDTTSGGLTRLDWILAQAPDILVVELGGNDALRGQPLEHTERNLREIVDRGLAAGARVVLLGMDLPANYGPEYAAAFAAMYERIAADAGVALVPGFVRGLAGNPELIQPDGLHPTAAGQRLLAETLAPHLEKSLASLERGPQGSQPGAATSDQRR